MWLITGAGRGLGVDIAKAVLAAGHSVVATGRDAARPVSSAPSCSPTPPLTYAQPTIDDYAEQTKEIVAAWKSMDGKQGGDPGKLADAS